MRRRLDDGPLVVDVVVERAEGDHVNGAIQQLDVEDVVEAYSL